MEDVPCAGDTPNLRWTGLDAASWARAKTAEMPLGLHGNNSRAGFSKPSLMSSCLQLNGSGTVVVLVTVVVLMLVRVKTLTLVIVAVDAESVSVSVTVSVSGSGITVLGAGQLE